jgi:S-adenosylmethionine decarboxylase
MAHHASQVPFGMHLMIDAYDCKPEVLNDKDLVSSILAELPEKIGMTKMMEPVVMWADANDKKDPGGWSGFVMIKESHIAIHTFIKRRFVTIDVYSCKEFDAKTAIKFFSDKLKTTDLEIHEEIRGTKYPEENID